MNPSPLSLLETRVLAALVEKQRTVPDTYPLSLNALVAACNQKTARDPVIEANDGDVQAALDELRSRSLVMENSGGRVARYSHNFGKAMQLPEASVVLLAMLMLRGPQTAGELRIHCERMYKFADISSVEAYLQELADRPAGALVILLPRAPGSRESRWAHLLSGAPTAAVGASGEGSAVAVGADANMLSALRSEVEHLRAEVASLREQVAKLCQELGV